MGLMNFKNYSSNILKESLSFDKNKNSIISFSAFEELLKSNKNFAIIIDSSNSILESKQRRYIPLIYSNLSNLVGRVYLTFQKINENEKEFRNDLNNTYSSLQNISILYRGNQLFKILNENNLQKYTREKESIQFYNDILSTILKKNVQIHGVEIPTTNELQTEFRKSSLICLPLNENYTKTSIRWKNL